MHLLMFGSFNPTKIIPENRSHVTFKCSADSEFYLKHKHFGPNIDLFQFIIS